jgi:hypothetical protein
MAWPTLSAWDAAYRDQGWTRGRASKGQAEARAQHSRGSRERESREKTRETGWEGGGKGVARGW